MPQIDGPDDDLDPDTIIEEEQNPEPKEEDDIAEEGGEG